VIFPAGLRGKGPHCDALKYKAANGLGNNDILMGHSVEALARNF